MQKEFLEKIAEVVDPPDFVKEGELLDEEDITQLPPSAFAGDLEYPVHTKSATWLSCCRYFHNYNSIKGGDREYTGRRLIKAAKEWGLDFEQIGREYKDSLEKKAEEPKYALEAEGPNGQPVKLCPINTKDLLFKAAKWLYENRSRLPFEWRKKIASTLLNESIDNYPDALLPRTEYIHKAAGLGLPHSRKIAAQFAIRAQFVNNEELSEALNKTAEALYDSDLSLEDQKKCASFLAAVDEQNDLYELYDRGLETPEEAVYYKTAHDLEKIMSKATKLPNGSYITNDQIEQADIKKIARVIGGQFQEELFENALYRPTVEEVKEAVNHLSSKEASLLERLLPESEVDVLEELDLIDA